MSSQFFCGVDLAKHHFSLHAVDDRGKVILHKSVSRAKLLTKLANMPAMRIGIEACSGAHYWARAFTQLGHDTRIMAAKYVSPYRTKGKNDLNDAIALCEAVQRPNTRFVPVKSPWRQAILAAIGKGEQFDAGRDFAAWLGLVPKQYSTGGKPRLGRMSKRGDKYLRTLLVHGARAVITNLGEKQDRLSIWRRSVLERRGMNRAIVALAAKNARIIWALLHNQTEYQDYAA